MPFASGNCCQKGCSELWAMLVSRKRRDRAQLGAAKGASRTSFQVVSRPGQMANARGRGRGSVSAMSSLLLSSSRVIFLSKMYLFICALQMQCPSPEWNVIAVTSARCPPANRCCSNPRRRVLTQLVVAVAGYIVSSEFMARKRRGRPVFIMVHLQTVETESYT